MSVASLIVFAAIGILLGAIPATVMEIVTTVPWSPAVLTAFGMPMCVGAGAGAAAWIIADLRRSAR
jgi:hypothetical protein